MKDKYINSHVGPLNMSHIMDFCLCKNKGADQLCSNCTADQRFCFCYTDNTIPLLPKLLTIFCSCTGQFVSDLVGNPEKPRVVAHIGLDIVF